MSLDPRHKSHTLLDGRERAPARSYLKAIGFADGDLARPIVGVANTWTETMPCNFNLRRLAEHVKRGVREAGGTPMEFNTIAISDGITMGTEGMKTSLVSREVIADSIELVARGHMFDALVVLVGCDKTIPGGAMALLRVDVPGFVVYGGSLPPGRARDGHAPARPPSARDRGARGLRQRDRGGGGDGGVDERRPPSPRAGARGRRAAHHRRLRPREPAHASVGRSEAVGSVHRGRPRQRGRRGGGRQAR